jgi:Predicted permeases
MIENFLIVLEQVIVLFTLTAIGFICGKANVISEKDESCLASLILYIAAPCVIISSFQRDFNNTLLAGFLTTLIVFTGIYVIGIIISKLTIKSKDERKKHVLQFAVIVGNCGIMGIPLAQSIFGDEGVFYIAAIIAVYNIMIWTYGLYLISNGNGSIQIKN